MKHKFLFLLVLLCMSLCSIKSWAQLERPTMPAATLESGKSYYLYNTPVRDKKPKENLVISIIFRIFVGENQTFTNNKKRLPNDFKGQSYRNFLYYR